jgi:hypothetical protein
VLGFFSSLFLKMRKKIQKRKNQAIKEEKKTHTRKKEKKIATNNTEQKSYIKLLYRWRS